MKIQWKKVLVLSLAAVLLGTNIVSLAEESAQSRRFSVLSVSGEEAYVAKGAVKEVKATAGMPLGQGSRVKTGALTSVYVQADDDKTIKLDSNSQAEITKVSSKALKITLKSGEMFFNVDKPLKEGEELTFDAAQTSMSIRGTSGILGFIGNQLVLYLVEGQVQWMTGNDVVTIQAGQMAVLVPDSGNQLQANHMNSAYQLKEITEFHWSDLPAMGLEAVLEQGEYLDLSAIGLESAEEQEQAVTRLAQMKQEKEARERAQAEKEEQLNAGNTGSAGRIDGEEPADKTNRRDRSQSGGGAGGGAGRDEESRDSADSSTSASVDSSSVDSSSTSSSVDSSTSNSVDSSTGSSVDSSTGSSVDSSTGSSVDSSTSSSVDSSTGSSVDSSTGSGSGSDTGSDTSGGIGSDTNNPSSNGSDSSSEYQSPNRSAALTPTP